MPKTRCFDNNSQQYDQWFDEHSIIFEAELAALRTLMPDNLLNGLEVGVGTGRFAKQLNIKIGIEPSHSMAAIANNSEISVINAVAEQLPFLDKKFDLVLMVTVICFLDDVQKALTEAYRVLQTNGSIIVGFIDKDSDLGKQYMDTREQSLFYKDAVFHSASEVISYIEQAGFTAVISKQALIPLLPENTILDGYGQGAFVAIRGIKYASNEHSLS